jgi:NAD(P)-dependent dehydrogenase (short-subunit alcohol dehydrogenase family)
MKIAIVTGAAGNMGNAIVKKFLEKDHFVIGAVAPEDRNSFNDPDTRFEKSKVDLLNEEDTNVFINSVIEKYGRIDVVVLTVGGFAKGNVAETSTSDITRQISLNFESAYNVIRPVFLQMKKQGSGRIFMTGARPGLDSSYGKGMVAYSLGKSLLFRLADLLNEEAKGLDVVTSVIVPSTIDTAQNREAMPSANYSDWVKPEEIAEIVYFHSTPVAKSLRENIIKVYGGS